MLPNASRSAWISVLCKVSSFFCSSAARLLCLPWLEDISEPARITFSKTLSASVPDFWIFCSNRSGPEYNHDARKFRLTPRSPANCHSVSFIVRVILARTASVAFSKFCINLAKYDCACVFRDSTFQIRFFWNALMAAAKLL